MAEVFHFNECLISPEVNLWVGTWTERRPAGDANKYWYAVASDSDGSNLIAGGGGSTRLWTSADSGANWTERYPPGGAAADGHWNCVASDDDGSNLIVGDADGLLYTSANGGVSWTLREPPGAVEQEWYVLTSSSDGAKLMAAAYAGRLWTSADSGANWTERRPDGVDETKAWQCGTSSADGSRLIIGADGDRLWISSNSGVDWTELRPSGDVNNTWECIAISADYTKIVAGTDSGYLYYSVDSGTNWTDIHPPDAAGDFFKSISMDTTGTKLIVVCIGGRIWASVDSGDTWTEQQPAGDVDKQWYCLDASHDLTKAIAGPSTARLYTGVGTLTSDASATRIDTYATGVSANLNINYNEIRDESGKVTQRVERSRDASLDIDAMYASEIDFTAGDNLRLLYANALGTTTYQLGSAYISSKGWSQSEDSGVTHNVSIVGGNFGTV